MSIEENMKRHNQNLSKFATKDDDAVYLQDNVSHDIRTNFSHDGDRIIYAESYMRYMDKTQVFSFTENDHVSKRMSHVQFVSKIARTIGRALALNEDLIEAAALGHDLGHVPFGHVGEHILNEISLKYGEGYFKHNIQSVRTLMSIENNGFGKCISVQVLDAIMCHNGEVILNYYEPAKKTKEDFLREYKESYVSDPELKPMTLEGCVVRVSDLIAYIGRDIEDALRLGIIKTKDIPLEIRGTLGKTNSDIVNTIIMDIIHNSYDKPYLKISDHIYKAIEDLEAFNYENIYAKANSSDDINTYRIMFNELFEKCLKDVENKDLSSSIYEVFLKNKNDEYLNNTPARIVIDYIAGMTDDFFIKEYENNCKKRSS